MVENLAANQSGSLMRPKRFIAILLTLLIPLPSALAGDEESQSPSADIVVKLSISADRYDPMALSGATVKCSVENKSKQPIEVPVGYDGTAVRLCGKAPAMIWAETLSISLWHPGPTPGGGRPGMVSKPPKLDQKQVLPGQQQVVFELPLDAVLLNKKLPQTETSIHRDWYWSWPARSSPPHTPIHLARGDGFADQTSLWAVIEIAGKSLSSEMVALKVRSGSAKDPKATGPAADKAETKGKQSNGVPLNQLPRRLTAAVRTKFPNVEILEATKEPYTPAMMDTESWGLTVKDGDRRFELGILSISGSYQVNQIRDQIALADVPKPALEALAAKYPGAKIDAAWKTMSGLISLPAGKTKPPDIELDIVTADRRSLHVNFTPELRQSASGEFEPKAEKMVFGWESER